VALTDIQRELDVASGNLRVESQQLRAGCAPEPIEDLGAGALDQMMAAGAVALLVTLLSDPTQ